MQSSSSSSSSSPSLALQHCVVLGHLSICNVKQNVKPREVSFQLKLSDFQHMQQDSIHSLTILTLERVCNQIECWVMKYQYYVLNMWGYRMGSKQCLGISHRAPLYSYMAGSSTQYERSTIWLVHWCQKPLSGYFQNCAHSIMALQEPNSDHPTSHPFTNRWSTLS
jgi:hypothetical protein